MSAKISARKIDVTEAALLSHTALKAYNDHYLHLWFDSGQWYKHRCFTKEVLEAELKDSNNLFFLAYLYDEPVGFLKLKIDAALETEPIRDAMELERIYLTQAASGQGIGRLLMELSFRLPVSIIKI